MASFVIAEVGEGFGVFLVVWAASARAHKATKAAVRCCQMPNSRAGRMINETVKGYLLTYMSKPQRTAPMDGSGLKREKSPEGMNTLSSGSYRRQRNRMLARTCQPSNEDMTPEEPCGTHRSSAMRDANRGELVLDALLADHVDPLVLGEVEDFREVHGGSVS